MAHWKIRQVTSRSKFIKFNKYYWKNLNKTGIWNNGAFSYTLEHFKDKKIYFKRHTKKALKLKWKRSFFKKKPNYKPKSLQIKKTNLIYVVNVFLRYPHFFNNLKFFSIHKKPRNVFIHISSLHGNIIKTYSAGMLYKKGSERRTFIAFEDLLRKNDPFKVKRRQKFSKFTKYIFKFKANVLHRAGFKRNIKGFLRRTSKWYKFRHYDKLNAPNYTKNVNRRSRVPDNPFYKFIGLKCRAHNGVRKKKKKRK